MFSIFPEGTDLLIPLSDSERHLVEFVLNQLEKMVSIEVALKRMKERAKKKSYSKPTASSATSSLSSPFSRGEKRKENELSLETEREPQKKRKETLTRAVELVSILFPPEPLICP